MGERANPTQGVLASWTDLPPPEAEPETGTLPLGLGGRRDGLILAPEAARERRPLPLLVMLHGAGAGASDVAPMVADLAMERSVLVLLPESRGATWDMIRRDFGEDVAFLDRALAALRRRYAVDPRRVALAGFSDGASYALSLGLINGAIFSDVLAFSPGFAAPTRREDAPRLFIRHGREDPVLPIERCGRRLAQALRPLGFDLDYAEFEGGHVVRKDDVRAALDRFLGRGRVTENA